MQEALFNFSNAYKFEKSFQRLQKYSNEPIQPHYHKIIITSQWTYVTYVSWSWSPTCENKTIKTIQNQKNWRCRNVSGKQTCMSAIVMHLEIYHLWSKRFVFIKLNNKISNNFKLKLFYQLMILCFADSMCPAVKILKYPTECLFDKNYRSFFATKHSSVLTHSIWFHGCDCLAPRLNMQNISLQ